MKRLVMGVVAGTSLKRGVNERELRRVIVVRARNRRVFSPVHNIIRGLAIGQKVTGRRPDLRGDLSLLTSSPTIEVEPRFNRSTQRKQRFRLFRSALSVSSCSISSVIS